MGYGGTYLFPVLSFARHVEYLKIQRKNNALCKWKLSLQYVSVRIRMKYHRYVNVFVKKRVGKGIVKKNPSGIERIFRLA